MPKRSAFVRAGLLFAAVLLLSCRVSPAGKFLGVSVGSQPWRLVRSAHFTIRVEALDGEAREVAIDLERSYHLLADLAFPMEKDPNLHTDVVLFRTREDYERVGPKGSAGYYTSDYGSWGTGGSTFLSFGALSPGARRRLVHELTHRFVHLAFPQAPIWLNEGLAEYFETIRVADGNASLGGQLFETVRAANGRAILGDNWRRLVRGDSWALGIPLDALPTLDALWDMDARAFYAGRMVPDGAEGTAVEKEAEHKQSAAYTSAWAMVHVLRNGGPENAAHLQTWFEKMAAGEPARSAFEASFGAGATQDLELQHRAFLERYADRRVTLLTVEYEAKSAPPLEQREMRPAEINTMWGWALLESGTRNVDTAHLQGLAAQEAEPSSAEAHLLLAACYLVEASPELALEQIRLAVKAAPGDEVAQNALLSRLSLSRKAEDRAEVDAIIAEWIPRAKTADMLNNLAWHMTLRGRAEEAVPLARKSTLLDPSCDVCFDTVALALLRTGQYKAAIEVETLAANLAGEGRSSAEYLKKVDRYKAVNSAIVLWKKRPEPGKDPSLLPSSVVSALAAAQEEGAEDCYERRKAPSAAGVVVVRGEIGKDGKVTGAKAVPAAEWGTLPEKISAPALDDEVVTACVVEQLAGTRFPESSAPSTFTAPFKFAPPPKPAKR